MADIRLIDLSASWLKRKHFLSEMVRMGSIIKNSTTPRSDTPPQNSQIL